MTGTAADDTRLHRRWWDAAEPWAAMLIVHGLGEHIGRYQATAEHFAARGISVRSFDLPGFGRSEGHRAYVDRFDHYLDDVAEQLAWTRELGLPTVLLGHSLGGLIALAYTLSDRPSPDYLVLSAPALDAKVPAVKRFAATVLSRVAPKLSLPNDIEGDQLSSDPAVGEAYFEDELVHTKTTARLGAEILAAMGRTRATVDRLAVPTLVIHGGADTIVPPSASAPLGELSGVERHLLPQFRHESFNEVDKEQAWSIVTEWVAARVQPA